MRIAAAFVYQGEHRSTQRLGASDRRRNLELGEGAAGEGDRGLESTYQWETSRAREPA